MNLLEIIETSIEQLPEGQHTNGLKSVFKHLDAAHRHIARGQKEEDISAFSDAVYRTNQAFEGGIREAYRVIAGDDPNKSSLTLAKIEEHLTREKIFTDRVLSHFTKYRKEWRNTSTHDYTLSFDEDEAFLATVSVCAFIKVLVNQISSALTASIMESNGAQIAKFAPNETANTQTLSDYVSELVESFFKFVGSSSVEIPLANESQFSNAIAYFLKKNSKDLSFKIEHSISTRPEMRRLRADMIISRNNEELIVEIKSVNPKHRSTTMKDSGLGQLEAYLKISGINNGMLILFNRERTSYTRSKILSKDRKRKITLIEPISEQDNK